MHRVLLTILLASLGLFALSGPWPDTASAQDRASAQESASTDTLAGELFVDSVDVQVVNVDVIVTDRQGNPITDLTQDDFKLYQDGDRVEISHFARVHRPPAAQSDAPTLATLPSRLDESGQLDSVQEPLLMVVYLDQFNIRPRNRARVLPALRTFLQDHISPQAPAMLVTFERSLHIAQPFTRDRQELLAAVDATGLVATEATLIDQNILRSRMEIENAGRAGGGRFGTGSAMDAIMDEVQLSGMQASGVREQIRGSVDSLESFVNSLSGLPHRKALIYISDGLPNGGTLEAAYERMARTANASRVTFYTIDTRGPDRETALGADSSGLGSDQNLRMMNFGRGFLALEFLADATGGVAITNTFGFDTSLAKLSEDFQHGYSLGYTLQEPDAKYHQLRVKVGRRGAQVRHREGYLARTPRERLAQSTIAALTFDALANPLRLSLLEEVPAQDSATEIQVVVRMPLRDLTLVAQDGVRHGLLHFFVAMTQDGNLHPLRELKLPVRIPEAEFASAPEFLAYRLKLPTFDESLTVAVGARDPYDARDSFVRLHLGTP